MRTASAKSVVVLIALLMAEERCTAKEWYDLIPGQVKGLSARFQEHDVGAMSVVKWEERMRLRGFVKRE